MALAEIHKRVLEQYAQQSALWNQELAPALERAGISIATIDACTEDELNELAGRFDREVYPVLTPLAVGPGQPFPYISGLSLSLGVLVRDRHTAEERFARREGAGGAAAVRRRRRAAVRWCRWRRSSATLPRGCSRAWRSSSRSSSG